MRLPHSNAWTCHVNWDRWRASTRAWRRRHRTEAPVRWHKASPTRENRRARCSRWAKIETTMPVAAVMGSHWGRSRMTSRRLGQKSQTGHYSVEVKWSWSEKLFDLHLSSSCTLTADGMSMLTGGFSLVADVATKLITLKNFSLMLSTCSCLRFLSR